MNKNQNLAVLAGVGLAVAGGIAYLAARSAGPVPLPKYTELRAGALQEHLVTEAGLANRFRYTPHFYPIRVGPQISAVITHGWSQQYHVRDPQADALPAEQEW